MDKLMQKAMEKHKIVRYQQSFIDVMTTYKSLLEAEIEQLHKHNVSNSLPADADMWKQEYDGACREIMSLQEQLKEAEREIADLNAELRNAHF